MPAASSVPLRVSAIDSRRAVDSPGQIASRSGSVAIFNWLPRRDGIWHVGGEEKKKTREKERRARGGSRSDVM